MKIDLHCALPYTPLIPNAALGYLKGYLSKNKKDTIRNFYWNLFPKEINEEFNSLVYDLMKLYNVSYSFFVILYATLAISKNLYSIEKNIEFSSLDAIYNSQIFYKHDIKKITKNIKSYIHTEIEQESLANVDIAGFAMKTNQWLFNYYIMKKLKKENPEIKLVLGGLQTEEEGLQYMRIFKEADFAIWGEGEIPFTRLIQQFDDLKNYRSIPNLIIRNDKNIYSTSQISESELPDFNKYPFPDHSDYINTINKLDIHQNFKFPIQGTRSCLWNKCKFCVLSEGIPYRERSPENIVKEIEYQSKKYDIDGFMFIDEDIGRKNNNEFIDLLHLLIKSSNQRKKPYHIVGEISPIRLNAYSIKLMKKISFDSVQIGFEAMTDNLLKKMLKKQSFAHNIQALKFAEEQNFDLTGLNVIRGIPTETEEDVFESIENLKFLRFYLHKFPIFEARLGLYYGSTFYDEISPSEVEKYWNYSPLYPDIAKFKFMNNTNKRDFLFRTTGFSKGLTYSNEWAIFVKILKKYSSEIFKYKWMAFPNGSSVIIENEGEYQYKLDKIETEVLIYCNMTKTYTDLKNQFKNLKEEQLLEILYSLKDIGLIYFNDKSIRFIISIINKNYINYIN